MKAKIIFFTLATTLVAANLFAQTSFGLRGGINFYNINGKDVNGDKLDNKIKTGFNVGVNAEIPVGIDFYLQPGVLFTTKGAKEVDGPDNSVSLAYVEIPVNFLYKPELGTGRLLLGFGPYAAFGVGGSYKVSGAGSRDVKFKGDITAAEALSGDLYVKRFDAGGNLLFGYEFANKFSAQLNASLGLVNINPDVEGNQLGESSTKNTGFGVSVGYRF